MSYYTVRIRVLLGDRRSCNFVASAGLGITGFGIHKILALYFKPDEVVDKERVDKLMQHMIKSLDEESADSTIINYEIISITLVE